MRAGGARAHPRVASATKAASTMRSTMPRKHLTMTRAFSPTFSPRLQSRLVVQSTGRHQVVTTAGEAEPTNVKFGELTDVKMRTPMGDTVTMADAGKPVVLHLLRRFG